MSKLHTSLCDDLKIEYPVFLAGMGVKGHATPPGLVAAVSDAGGMGILGCSWLDSDEVRRRIRAVRNLTDRPFGVDLLLPASMDVEAVPDRAEMRARIERDHPKHAAFAKSLLGKFGLQSVVSNLAAMSPEFIRRQVDVCLEERIAVFAAGLGDPSWVVPMAHQVGMKVMGLVGNVRNAERQKKGGVDYGRRPHRKDRKLPADPDGGRCGEAHAGDRGRCDRRRPHADRRPCAGRGRRLGRHRVSACRRVQTLSQAPRGNHPRQRGGFHHHALLHGQNGARLQERRDQGLGRVRAQSAADAAAG
ncbi:MAG: nitronate monooxygenase, partial [Alphaproteobacteria bacterium]|nr:nitronate monooxygenase [Alphaproteobacteria bacterium]